MGVLTDAHADEVKDWALAVMRDGIAAAEAEPEPDVSLVFDRAYADPPASLAADLAELRRILG
jgi:TPP-dependent pyruvate/acetoin dehydrogenase alpha subunit